MKTALFFICIPVIVVVALIETAAACLAAPFTFKPPTQDDY